MLVARSDPHHWRRLPPQGQQSEHRERSKGETLHSTLLWIQTLAWPEALGEEKLPNCERPCRGSAVKAKWIGWLGAKQNCPSRHNEPTHSLKERAGPKWPKGWAQCSGHLDRSQNELPHCWGHTSVRLVLPYARLKRAIQTVAVHSVGVGWRKGIANFFCVFFWISFKLFF